ncbi:CoA transferase [Ramlibacter sp.]|uniref:CoA transferase n=1 Tax=Ramlibacter sp. TaxID=1917967 RepID=UPI0025FF433D|nr:CoA transferase [Ramlibacter sp.]
MCNAIGLPPRAGTSLRFTGAGELPSAFAVTDFAAAAIATPLLALSALLQRITGHAPEVGVDRRLSAMWFHSSIRPMGWSLPSPWDPIAGDYACRDGWIRLHTNAPHHRAAAERVLGAHADRDGMAQAVARWDKANLEAAVVAGGGCAAEMRSVDAWRAHPQGQAVATEPLVHMRAGESSHVRAAWHPVRGRPLQGIRVLDLTRVLAGPVATRFLAGHGAQVLRIDPPDWDEPAVIPEVVLGKRSARLDLRTPAGRETFAVLLAGADVLVHGLRPGALGRLGFGPAERRALAPGLIDVSLDAYGWSGPWAGRRGFDSLVQMSTGIADAGMAWRAAGKPVPLPMQALDHATGYLMAAAAVRGIAQRLDGGESLTARLSLARTAQLLMEYPARAADEALPPETPDDRGLAVEATAWGPAQRLKPPGAVAGAAMHWDLPARQLGGDAPIWF